jgi:CheY-like chemotaxis protein
MSNKLLLADDSITIRKVVGIIFANEDYALSVVDNGNAALEKAREIIPDIILADVLMPGNTGYEVCAEVRRDPALKHIPLLLLTGAFEPFDEEKARQSGADDFISKPFESQQLIEKVKILIELGKERKLGLPVPEPETVAAPQISPAQFTVPSPETSFLGEMGGVFPPLEETAEEPSLQADQFFTAEDVTEEPSLQTDQLFAVEEVAQEPSLREADQLISAEVVTEAPSLQADQLFAMEDVVEEPSLQPDQLAAPEEIIEANPDEDLWDVFSLEEVAEGEAAGFEAVLEEEPGESFDESEAVEEFTFAEEEDDVVVEEVTTPFDAGLQAAAAPTELTSDMFDHLGEEPSITGDELPPTEPDAEGVFEFEEEPVEQATFVSGLDEAPPVAAPAVPEYELQFAPEEEYVPVLPPVEPIAPPVSLAAPVPPVAPVTLAAPVTPAAPVAVSPAVQGEPGLSEEQLASIVAKISRDIIEKIAWEVVPDLAETLIRDEIRKLKEGLRG